MPTLGDRVRDSGGYTSGFDYIRIILAFLVMFGHSFIISGDTSMDIVMPWGLATLRGYLILPMFFTLSGFLVAASLVRTHSLSQFMALRVLRIVPALFVEISLSALIIGPLLTQVSFSDYVLDPQFKAYFLNIIGLIHYQLPGVFLDHPLSGIVNGSLWTVPYEAECYVLLAALAFLKFTRKPMILLALFVAATLSLAVFAAVTGVPANPAATATGRQLLLFFISGIIVYLLREKLPFSGYLALAATGLTLATITSPSLIYLSPLPTAYIVAYLGLMQPRKLPVVFNGDYSYGIYLYSFPIQKAVVQLVPHTTWYANFLLALPIVAIFAAFSWHWVEKPTLRLKKMLVRKPGPSTTQAPAEAMAKARPAPASA